MLRPGTNTPDQCCAGYCVPIPVIDDDRTDGDRLVHDLRGDQAHRLSELLDSMDPVTRPGSTKEGDRG